jgi:hypothetical protein
LFSALARTPRNFSRRYDSIFVFGTIDCTNNHFQEVPTTLKGKYRIVTNRPPPLRGSRIDRVIKALQANLARHQFVHHLDQMFERATEAIELPNDKNVSG